MFSISLSCLISSYIYIYRIYNIFVLPLFSNFVIEDVVWIFKDNIIIHEIYFSQVQKQVQPTLTVQIEALVYLEELLLQLLQQLCAFQPHNVGDVEMYIHSKFPPQIREWAINSARSTVEKKKKGTLTLPVDKLQLIMQKVPIKRGSPFFTSKLLVVIFLCCFVVKGLELIV